MEMQVALIIASDSGHTSWWIGLPIVAVILIVRLGFWRGRGRRGRSRDDGDKGDWRG
jgi:hypothetical protein